MTHTPTPAHQPGMTGGSMSEQLSGWTRHGHRIEGVAQIGRPQHVARCGGPGLCTKCSVDAARPKRAPEATDPTPGEVGLSAEIDALATVLHDWVGGCCVGRFDRCAFGGDGVRDEATRLLAYPAMIDLLAARTAHLRSEHAAEVEKAREDGRWEGYAAGKDEAETRDLNYDEATSRAEAAEAERDAARREERMRAEDHARAWREVAELRADRDRLRGVIWSLGESIHGDEGVEHSEGCEGEPDCFACILDTLRAALTAHRHEEA